jgi:UDP-3-O-[3-hydroxymyristoyl] glucosamine N-acyltransferase
MRFTAQEIAKILGGTIEGNTNAVVNSVAKIEEAIIGDLCFLANEKYIHHIYSTNASVVITNDSFHFDKKIKATLIKVVDAYLSFSQLLEVYNKMKFNKKGVSKKADISSKVTLGNNVYIGAFTSICEGVTIGDNVKIHPNCYIGENVVIGDNCIIFPLVSIYHDCKLGVNNIVHSGVKIGSDGFGFAPNADNKYKKISHIGIVEIGDDVEIGSNTTIDRATMGSTKIRNGVKLDNLIQIAHNVEIGENTVIAAQACVAGSTKIGKNCLIGGQVAISGHITIADQVKVAGQSGIASSVSEKGVTIQGPMAFDLKQFQRSYILFKKLPEIYKTLNSIKDQFNV